MATFVRVKETGVIYLHHHIYGKRFKKSTGIVVAEDKWKSGKAVNNLVLFNKRSVNQQLENCKKNLYGAIEDVKTLGGGMPELVKYYESREAGRISNILCKLPCCTKLSVARCKIKPYPISYLLLIEHLIFCIVIIFYN